jgi:type 1 glutamine amidotransferase
MLRNCNFIVLFIILSLTLPVCSYAIPNEGGLIKVLILSGKNNHEWQKTTPLLVEIFKEAKCFTTKVTDLPDTFNYKELKRYDVVVSNWNSWPDNDFRMTAEWENDFLKYVNEGGGVVSIHAGASSFYGWKEYHQMGIGRWGKETRHGEQTKGKVCEFEQASPITKSLLNFYIVDEIWEKADIYPGSKVLASISATDNRDGHLINEPAVFVNSIGKGHCFYTILGHNERALLNSGLRTILQRATQWAAGREVTIDAPAGLKETVTPAGKHLHWLQTDTSFTLMNNMDVIWQYNFNNRFGKPYFHPVMAKKSALTCVSPPDHPWHLGLWFSWKFINGVNYWEYQPDPITNHPGYKSEGVTETNKISIEKKSDFSADIRMELLYHPIKGSSVLMEKRTIHVSSLLDDGSYFMDFEHIFKPLVDEVILDRTPIEGEPDGKSWGGYAGLSIRFNEDYTTPEVIAPTESENFRKKNWIYMGFNTLTGERAGMSIMQNPAYTTSATSWYVINNPEIPFFYFSPAILFDHKIMLKKGEVLHVKYRVWILPGAVQKADLQVKFDQYLKK